MNDPHEMHQTHKFAMPAEAAEALAKKIAVSDAAISYWLWHHPEEAADFVARWAPDREHAAAFVADALRQIDVAKATKGTG